MERKRLKYLITNLFANSLTLAERVELDEWIESQDAEIASGEFWDSASYDIDSSIKNEIWNNIQANITERATPVNNVTSKINSNRLFSIFKYAACIAMIIGTLITSYFYWDHNKDNSGEIFSFQVEPGQKGNIKLADGTIVYLNSASKISFDTDYNSNDRIVNLTGEAYFEVAKNPNKKFIVLCNGMEVEALGTAFNVKAYPSDSIITTTLAEGRVKVSCQEQSITLLPKDAATYNLKRHTMQTSTVEDIAVADYWRSGQLVFSSESLASIAKTIERMYNVKVNINDSELKEMKFTGTIQNNSLTNIIHIISLSYPLSYSMNDSVITISSL